MMNDVEVFQVPWGEERWRIRCAHCECWCPGFQRWDLAYSAALAHADRHEQKRCVQCGRTS